MIRHLLISSAFMLVNTFIFATTANAEEGSASASGSVASSCNLGNPIDGNLGVNDPSNPTTLSSNVNGGTAAKVDITCNGDATLTISKPIQTKLSGKTEFSDNNLTATAKNSTFDVNVSSESNSTNNNIFANTSTGRADMTLDVNMEALNGGNRISPGDYKFTVTITSTP